MPRCSIPGPLGFEVAKYQLLKERLIAEFPTSDAETLTDTLEGITDLKEMLAAVIRSSLFDHALAKGLKDRIETMRERLEGLAFRAEKKRELKWVSRPCRRATSPPGCDPAHRILSS